MTENTYVVGEAPRGIRRGQAQHVADDEFTSINVFNVRDNALGGTGLDPARIALIHGVVELASVNDPDAIPSKMVEAFGEKLYSNGALAMDLLVVPPGSGFPPHVHPGHHLLMALTPGTFSLHGVVNPVVAGDLYMVEGGIPHGVGNPYDTPHIILAVGAPPKELDATNRMTVVDWNGQPVMAPEGYCP